MKKFFFFLAFISTLSLSAQDWAPYPKSDSIRHYLSESTVNLKSISSGGSLHNFLPFYPIQSMKVDQKTTDTFKTELIFRKGISFNQKIIDSSVKVFGFKSIIKSKVLGDTLLIFKDSTICKTLDSLGFRLNFPHRYRLNQNWVLGKSEENQIQAMLDAMYRDSIPGFGFDSLVCFQIEVRDSTQNPDTTHPFHHTSVLLSKKHGMVSTIDFTELEYKHRLKLFNWGDEIYSKNDNMILSIGDEFHAVSTEVVYTNPEVTNQIYRVISDTLIDSNRTIQFQRSSQKKFPPPVGKVIMDTLTSSFDTSAIYSIKASLLLNQDCYGNSSCNVTDVFGLCESCTVTPIIRYRSNSFQFLMNFFRLNNDSVLFGRQLTSFTKVSLIGVGEESSSSQNTNGNSFYIKYIKKGNQTWGSPLGLITSLDENKLEKSTFQIVPNPAKENLQIETKGKFPVRQIELYDLSGRKQLSRAGKAGQSNYQMQLENMPPGLYFIVLQFEDGTRLTKKFVKQ